MIRILRLLPDFKGKQRLINFLLGEERNTIKDLLVPFYKKSKLILPNIIESSCFEIFCNRIYEKETIDLITNKLKKGSTFIDIGANIGAISIAVALDRPDVNIVSVEAAPSINDYLVRNFKLNSIENILSINFAIHEKINLTIPFYVPTDKIGCSSFSPLFTNDAIYVKTQTLDDLVNDFDLRSISLIKIDIEGYESKAFLGGKETLQGENAPDIIFEFMDWAEKQAEGVIVGDSQRVLLGFGYKLFEFNKKGNLKHLNKVVTTGSLNIFATKN